MNIVDGLQVSNWSRPVLEEMVKGGVSAVNATCAVWENAAETLRAIAEWVELLNQNRDLAFLAEDAQDIQRARSEGRVAIFLGFQNTSLFEDDYRLVETFHRLGVRVAQLTYNSQNLLGGGCFDPNDSSLTRYGSIIVAEMNRIGMMIDLSHVGNRTSLDAIAASAAPVAITHANPQWFHDSPRNKPDHIIQALVDRGGVIGVCLYPTVSGGKNVTMKAFITMIERLVDQFGPDHVGLGSDCTRGWDQSFVGWLRNGRWKPTTPEEAPEWPSWPTWFSGPADFPRLVDGISESGMSDEVIQQVFAENWTRLFTQVLEPTS